jgi:hypothetical protein
MNVKEAVAAAKVYVADLFQEENITDIGLEEVRLDDRSGLWEVTVGFSRPWDRSATGFAAVLQAGAYPKRSYKILRINNETGEVVSLANKT